jgi:hypothetical protein
MVVALAGQAMPEPRYDRRIEEAAMAIVAARMGDIRGGFAFDAKPMMVVVRDDIVMGTTEIEAVWAPAPPEGMARAVERGTDSPTAF